MSLPDKTCMLHCMYLCEVTRETLSAGKKFIESMCAYMANSWDSAVYLFSVVNSGVY